ncbi:MAG: SDR family NAD(P)-dependent oxidoreductase [Balneolaceae bacterium]|nr:SDR family NAD(P)-dependent oxidoreductase [Balneolaceae bacterium]
MTLSNKKILITGGSAGIGKALIEELSGHGTTDIAVMGRTAEKLDALEDQFPSVRFLKIQGDVSVLNDVKEAVTTVQEEWGALDILINNAGVVSAGLLEEISDQDISTQIEVNLTGLIFMTKHFLPLLKDSDEAALMNISSGLGYIAMPFYSVYAATKAGVKHFSEGMRRELADYPIHVMTVYPTSTDTPMMETANTGDMDSPQNVARASIEGLLNRDIEVILGGQQRLDDINTNVNQPQKMDEKVEGLYDALRKRAERHRSM